MPGLLGYNTACTAVDGGGRSYCQVLVWSESDRQTASVQIFLCKCQEGFEAVASSGFGASCQACTVHATGVQNVAGGYVTVGRPPHIACMGFRHGLQL